MSLDMLCNCSCPDPAPVCDGSNVILLLSDSWGDGWNGAALNINGEAYTVTSEDGARASFEVCVDFTTCVQATWTEGQYDYECTWSMIGPDGATVNTVDVSNFIATDSSQNDGTAVLEAEEVCRVPRTK